MMKQRDYDYTVYRLTRPYYYVKRILLRLFKGRSYDLKGDSRTPWSNMLDNHDSLHYSNRHGLHLNPSKSVGRKGKKNKQNS
jgi:hypothetical protein